MMANPQEGGDDPQQLMGRPLLARVSQPHQEQQNWGSSGRWVCQLGEVFEAAKGLLWSLGVLIAVDSHQRQITKHKGFGKNLVQH